MSTNKGTIKAAIQQKWQTRTYYSGHTWALRNDQARVLIPDEKRMKAYLTHAHVHENVWYYTQQADNYNQ
jgi:hypothetical protein